MGSVLFPYHPSLKLHQEVPKKKEISLGCRNSLPVTLALSLSSVLLKRLMAQQGTEKRLFKRQLKPKALIVHNVYLS